jgi:Glutamine amidotransferase domain
MPPLWDGRSPVHLKYIDYFLVGKAARSMPHPGLLQRPQRGIATVSSPATTVVRYRLVPKKSVGMFALALCDRTERTPSQTRDRMGEKPLYRVEVALSS